MYGCKETLNPYLQHNSFLLSSSQQRNVKGNKRMRITTKEFVSSDLYLSAAISILLQIQPTFRVENGRTLFVFEVSDRLYRAMSDYNSGIELNALEFVQVLKRLKSEMLMRRSLDKAGVQHG